MVHSHRPVGQLVGHGIVREKREHGLTRAEGPVERRVDFAVHRDRDRPAEEAVMCPGVESAVPRHLAYDHVPGTIS